MVCFVCAKDVKDYNKENIIKGFYNYFNDVRALKPIAYYDKNWTEEKYIEGCYFGVTNKEILSQYQKEFSKPFGNIYWAGTETANEWMGYIEGGLESAERVFIQILDNRNKKNKAKL